MTTKDFLTDPGFIKWVNHPDPESDAYWKNWMAAHPEHLPQLKLAREVLWRLRYPEVAPREGAKERILQNIMYAPVSTDSTPLKLHKPLQPAYWLWDRWAQWGRVAAIITVGCLLSWMLYQPQEQTAAPEVAEEKPMIQKHTASGEKLQLTLPDGTIAWLNSASDLTFPADFGEHQRVVYLSGEAFFEVEKDPLRPFSVHAKGTVTTALGTSFNINTKSSSQVNISLLTGKVKVEASAVPEVFFLDAGQNLQYEEEKNNVAIKAFNVRNVMAWKDGRLIFKETSLLETMKKLEEWYGVTIHLENAKGVHWKYSGEYQDQTLDNVLNSMAFVQEFRYKIEGNKVEIKF